MGNWQVGPVNSYIDIFPGWGTTQEKTWINIHHQRRRNGSLKSYQEPGEFEKFEMPMSWVSSGDRALVNSWAQNIMDLRLIPDSDSPSSYYDVRITNTQEPLTSAVKPYENFYQGEIVFETI